MTRESGDLPIPVTSLYTRGVQARTSVTVTLLKMLPHVDASCFSASPYCGYLYFKDDCCDHK